VLSIVKGQTVRPKFGVYVDLKRTLCIESIEVALMACKEVVLKVHINAERNEYSIMFMLRER
jgi:hypothetical protein